MENLEMLPMRLMCPMRRMRAPAAALLILLACVVCAQAAGLKGRETVDPAQVSNPRADADDFALPMPCNLSMVFRIVGVPVRGFLWDERFNMGSGASGRDGMEYYDRLLPQVISGPFTVNDLPPAWRKRLSGGQTRNQYYFVGKYEVTAGQWRAVTEGRCPENLEAGDVLPQTGISWYEAVDFTRLYNEWLLANAVDALPRFAGDPKNVGYVRLPMEAEWEFAARGGAAVPPDALRQQEFYTLEPGTVLADYAVYRPENAARIQDGPSPVGSRRPNPLGIHDMAGNVAEFMHDAFRFSLGNRLHGSAGGIVRKGGGFASSQEEIMPGRREEIPPLHARGPTRTRDSGLRLVLSGVNTPDGGRTDALKKEWAALGERDSRIMEGANPLEEIDRILALVEDPTARSNLSTLRGVIKNYNISLERAQDDAAENLMRTTIYMMETMRNYAVRLNLSMAQLKEHEQAEQSRTRAPERERALRREMIRQYRDANASFIEAVQASLLFYKSRLDDLALIAEEAYSRHLGLLRAEFAGADVFHKNMTANLKTMDDHRLQARQNKALPLDRLRADILPENLRAHLPAVP
jgi:hypothetical protein